MDSENEVRPLLHSSFENQSWRSKARKRCMKVPSEITITGIILGLFLVVVTLLIVLENMEAEKKDDISLGNNLLGSPFKYNKKAEDYSWQTKKENMKMKKTQQDLNQKWDNVNKGWKKFPDISGKISNNKGIRYKMLKETVETSDLPEVTDEYGKETDSLEMFLNLQESDTNLMKQFNKDATEIKDLLHSGIKWKDIDDGWKALSAQGWKESRIREALFKALKERREEIREAEGFLQSPIKLGDMWDKINDSWKKNINEGNKDIGYQKIKVNKEAEKQKNINDEWKDKMNILQSPKSSIKKFVKADGGWQKLGDQGWKNKDIEEALIEAWKEKDNDRDVLQSPVKVPLNIQSIWGKLTGFFKSLVQKGMDKQNSQKEINDEWANKFGHSLQSPQMSYKKWKKIDELRKKHSKDDQKDKNSDETGNQDIQPQQSTMNLKDLEDIIEAIKEYEKGQKEINDEYAKDFNNILQSSKKTKKIDELRKKHSKDDWKDKSSDKTDSENDSPEQSLVNFEDLEDIIKFIKENQKDMKDGGSDKAEKENEQPLQSPTKFDDFMGKIAEFIKDHQKGNKEAEKQKGINDEWKKNMQLSSSSKQTDKKWKQVDDHWKTLIEHERNSFFGKNDNDGIANPKDDSLQYSISLDNVKWEKIDDGWKKLTEQGWKDKDIKEAVYKAWKEGDKLLQSAMGHNNMKWKKVNDGWKKISNKSQLN